MNKISIIMPSYNSGLFIKESIDSVINQTYKNWELIIVDDCSNDNTVEIIRMFQLEDSRIKPIYLDNNKGAANARNIAIEKAEGDYIAFLDSDDIWNVDKLSEQINFMVSKDIDFSCTFYNKIDRNSNELGIVIEYPRTVEYNQLLKYCPGNSTVIYNSKKLGKYYVPKIKKRNDYLMWINIIKKAETLVCLEKCLGSHRVHTKSLSYDKKKLLKYHWEIYRKYENLTLSRSFFLLLFWIKKSVVGSKF
ncbi:glycosyltransferase family 2 protein [Enterococcus casseliflavus]|uniref:glycosyltransferase family 2 protein n=1 Tax=Enterococcus casseliflavus TaxID=37734 RepID=UPI0039A5C4A5